MRPAELITYDCTTPRERPNRLDRSTDGQMPKQPQDEPTMPIEGEILRLSYELGYAVVTCKAVEVLNLPIA